MEFEYNGQKQQAIIHDYSGMHGSIDNDADRSYYWRYAKDLVNPRKIGVTDLPEGSCSASTARGFAKAYFSNKEEADIPGEYKVGDNVKIVSVSLGCSSDLIGKTGVVTELPGNICVSVKGVDWHLKPKDLVLLEGKEEAGIPVECLVNGDLVKFVCTKGKTYEGVVVDRKGYLHEKVIIVSVKNGHYASWKESRKAVIAKVTDQFGNVAKGKDYLGDGEARELHENWCQSKPVNNGNIEVDDDDDDDLDW